MDYQSRMNLQPTRSRVRVLLLLALTVAIGIWSRMPRGGFPLHYKAVGDVLWATMFYLWVLLVAPRLSIFSVTGLTLAITFATEFLKLCHAPWLDSLRNGRLAGFLLGHTFYWHDFASYILGTFVAIAVDAGVLLRRR